jgi:hypothetical protein
MPDWDQERTASFGQRQASGALTIITTTGIKCSGCGKPIINNRCFNHSDIWRTEFLDALKADNSSSESQNPYMLFLKHIHKELLK